MPADNDKHRDSMKHTLRPRQLGLIVIALGLVGGLGGLVYLLALQPPAFPAAPPATRTPAPDPTAQDAARWSYFAGDPGSSQYSPLAQITRENVQRLEVAWTYRTGEAERRGADLARSSFSNTPVLAGDSLIVCTPWARVIALDPASGEERWAFDPDMKLDQPPEHRYICRGVAVWRDPQAAAGAACEERIVYGANDRRIFALDARTGARCAAFGANGEVRIDLDDEVFPGELQLNGPPAIVGDVVVFGSTVSDHVRPKGPSGAVRGFDLRTGELRWQFDPIPRDPADPAYATWENDSAIGHGGANAWADMSVDEQRGLVFIATSSPSIDYDGRDRPGDNRYANSVVALDGASGAVRWHFQIVHHDIWDYDLPTAPLLTSLQIGGRERDALIQLTKQGLVFVFDRESGEPLFPIEERPVPASDVPGEYTSPTQPFPTTMPWFMGLSLKNGELSVDDAWGFTFWDQGKCREVFERSPKLGLYTPPSDAGTVVYPWTTGGSNHGMRAYDPQRRLLIANIIRTVGVIGGPAMGEKPVSYLDPPMHYRGLVLSPLGAPCLRPPWGELIALDVEQQKIVWRVPLGTIEKQAKLPFLKLKYGSPSRGGPVATGGGVIFIAGTMDDAFRAFDTDTGEELWRTQLPAGGQATPMTYMANGRQYVVIAAGGHAWMRTKPGDYVIAYALPQR
jgi:quinoprotein glucose dehydrogenase